MANFLAGIAITTLFFTLIRIVESLQEENIESPKLTQEDRDWLEADLTEESEAKAWDDNRQGTEQGI